LRYALCCNYAALAGCISNFGIIKRENSSYKLISLLLMTDSQHLTECDIRALFIKHYAKLVAFASKFVEVEVAEDIVQDVFLQLLNKCGSISITVTLESYVYRAIKNKYFDYTKSKNVRDKYVAQAIQLSRDELNYFDPDKNLSLTLNENEQALYIALESLPPKCKEIIHSKYFSGKKTIQISEELGVSPRTVETHIYKAVKQLKLVMRNIYLFFILF